jgi:hypothetical protein
MQIQDKSLTDILGRASGPVEVRDEAGSFRGSVPRRVALALAERGYVGVGNRRRIRYLRPLSRGTALNAGSRLTRRVVADHTCRVYAAGQAIGAANANQEFCV